MEGFQLPTRGGGKIEVGAQTMPRRSSRSRGAKKALGETSAPSGSGRQLRQRKRVKYFKKEESPLLSSPSSSSPIRNETDEDEYVEDVQAIRDSSTSTSECADKEDGAKISESESDGGAAFLFSRWFEEAKVRRGVRSEVEDEASVPYAEVSPPIEGLEGDGDARTIERYQHCGVRREGASKTAAKRNEGYIVDDHIFFTGGSNWSLAWCPSVREDPRTSKAHYYIAIGPHPKGRELNVTNSSQTGKGVIQIVEVVCSSSPQRIEDVRLCHVLHHNGAVTWDVAWCPSPKAPSLGLLAAALGNGEVCIYCCSQGERKPKGKGEPQLAARRVVQSTDLQRRKAVPASIAWHPQEPHDKVLVGCWEGSVALFEIGLDAMTLVSFFSADVFPLRRVCWVRDPSKTQKASRHATCELYATAGESANLRIWNMNAPQSMLCNVSLSSTEHVMDLAMCEDPAGVVAMLSNGKFGFLKATEGGLKQGQKEVSENALSSVAIRNSYCLVTNYSGEVVLLPLSGTLLPFTKRTVMTQGPFVGNCVSSLSLERADTGGDGSRVILKDWEKDLNLKKQDVNPSHQIHAYRSAWMPADKKNKIFGCAHGYGGGLVRFQLIDKKKCDKYFGI